MTKPVDMKLEIVVIGVSDVDRAKAFYEKLGWRLDADFDFGAFRVVQVTPHNSETSVIFGKGITTKAPGSIDNLTLVVSDIEAARAELVANGVDASEVFHYAGGPFNNAAEPARIAGPDPERRSYYSFLSFDDPDGNGWLVQEIQTRFPGREWRSTDVGTLAELLHETEQHHGAYEKSHGEHHWWDWYAPYIKARQNGGTAEEASEAADRYMEKLSR